MNNLLRKRLRERGNNMGKMQIFFPLIFFQKIKMCKSRKASEIYHNDEDVMILFIFNMDFVLIDIIINRIKSLHNSKNMF